MVRHELHLGKEVLPREKLLSLWKVLDENESGFICAGEWGRFMNQRGVVTNPLPDPALIAKEKAREKEAHQRAAKAAEWKAQAATRAQAQAKKIAAEADRTALSAAMKGATNPAQHRRRRRRRRRPAPRREPELEPAPAHEARCCSTRRPAHLGRCLSRAAALGMPPSSLSE